MNKSISLDQRHQNQYHNNIKTHSRQSKNISKTQQTAAAPKNTIALAD
jgi:hypothetical protein